jgi:hypothetical protein
MNMAGSVRVDEQFWVTSSAFTIHSVAYLSNCIILSLPRVAFVYGTRGH